MAEHHEVRVSVDGRAAERGLARIDSAARRTALSLSQLDRTATTAFSSLARAASANNSANALSRAVAFRGPSRTAVTNTEALARALSRLNVSTQSAGAVAGVSAALGSYRGPSVASVRNTTNLIRLLETANASRIAGTARALAPLSALSGFRMGSVGAAVNSRGLGNLSHLAQYGANLSPFAASLGNVTRLVGFLGVSLATFSAGRFIGEIAASGSALRQFERTLASFSTSAAETAGYEKFVDDLTRRLPLSLRETQTAFGRVASAMRLSGATVEDTQELFANFSTAFAALNLSTEDQSLAWTALSQIWGKGQVMAEELKQQLGERLPAAVQLFAQSMGVSTSKLMQLMQAGEVSADKTIGFGRLLADIYGRQVPAAMASAGAQAVMLSNAVERQRQRIFDSGFGAALAGFFSDLTRLMQSRAITRLGDGFVTIFRNITAGLSALATVAANNLDSIATFVRNLALFGALASIPAVLRAIVSPLGLIVALATLATTLPDWMKKIALGIAGWQIASSVAVSVRFLADAILLLRNRTIQFALIVPLAADGVFALGQMIGNVASGKTWNDQIWTPTSIAIGEILKTIDDGINQISSHIGERDFFKTWFQAFQAAQQQADAFAKSNADFTDQFEENARRFERVTQQQADAALELTRNQQTLLDRIDPIGKASRAYANELALLEKLRDSGQATAEQFAQLKERLDTVSLGDRDPFADTLRKLGEEASLLKLTGDARELETRILRQKNELLEKGVVLTADQTAALHDLNAAMLDMERGGSNGFARWANGVEDFGEAIKQVQFNAVEGLADALANLVVDGTADFAALGRAILRELASVAIRSLLADVFKTFDSAPAAAARALANAQSVSAATPPTPIMPNLVQTMEVQAAVVNINPTGIGGTGLQTPFGPLQRLGGALGAEAGDPTWGLPRDRFDIGKPNSAPFTVIPVKRGDAAVILGGSGVSTLGTGGLSFEDRFGHLFAADTIKSLPATTIAPVASPLADMWGRGNSLDVSKLTTSQLANVDARLVDIVQKAADGYAYDVLAVSGFRAGDPRRHGLGQAFDISLRDPVTGQVFDNYQNASTFRLYEEFAQRARGIQLRDYPELTDAFSWGGYFSGPKGKYGALDSMHFDLGGSMAGGSWAGGLTSQQAALWPGIVSQGMGPIQQQLAAFTPALQSATATLTNGLTPSLASYAGSLGVFGMGLESASTNLGGFNSLLSAFANSGGGGTGGYASIFSALFPNFGGARAGGGDVKRGRAYLVGERRAEIFVPNANGTILPDANAVAGGGTRGDVHMHFPNVRGGDGFKRSQRQIRSRYLTAMHIANQRS